MAARLNYWKLAIWKGFSGSLIVILGGLPTIILNWTDMSGGGQCVAIIGLVVSTVKFLDGFMDQTASRLAQGRPLIALPNVPDNEVIVQKTGDTTITVKPTPS